MSPRDLCLLISTSDQSSLVAAPITFFGPLLEQSSWSPPQLTSNTILRDLLQPNNKPSALFSHWYLLFESFLNQLIDHLLPLISSSLCELTINTSSPNDHLPASTAHLSPLDASKQPVVFLPPSSSTFSSDPQTSGIPFTISLHLFPHPTFTFFVDLMVFLFQQRVRLVNNR